MTNEKIKDRFYYNKNFLGSSSGRSLRILSEYYGPLQRLEQNNISETIVFFVSARILSKEDAQNALSNRHGNISSRELARMKTDLKMSPRLLDITVLHEISPRISWKRCFCKLENEKMKVENGN